MALLLFVFRLAKNTITVTSYIAVFLFRVHKTIERLHQICTGAHPPSWVAVEEPWVRRITRWVFLEVADSVRMSCQVFCTRIIMHDCMFFSVPFLYGDAQIPCNSKGNQVTYSTIF